MKTVREILDAKGTQAYSVGPDDTVYEALSRMAERNVGALLVLEGEKLVGLLSERDYARKVVLRGGSSRDLAVRSIMSRNPLCVAPDRTVDECMALMTERRVRHLPVFDTGRLCGVVSIGDVVKAKLAEQEFLIDQLESYIKGCY